ncbi:hypothetical protein Hanom_Chr02g00121341 [Helianthus anomalus]
MISAQLVDALKMMGKDSGSTLDPTRVFYYSVFTSEDRLLWRARNSPHVAGGWKFSRGQRTPLSTRRESD